MAYFKPPVPGNHSGKDIFFLLLIGAGALLLLLGHNGLVGSEGDFANGVRLLLLDENISARSELWNPLRLSTVYFCYLFKYFSLPAGISEWSLRMPSVLTGLVTLWGCAVLADRLLDKRGMWFAGLMLLGSYGFLYWSRSAAEPVFAAAAVVWTAVAAYGNHERELRFRDIFVITLIFLSAVIFTGAGTGIIIILLLLPRICERGLFNGNGIKKMLYGISGGTAAVALAAVIIHIVFSRDISFGSMQQMCRFQQEILTESWRHFIAPVDGKEWYRELVNIPRLLLPWPLFTLVSVCGLFIHRSRITRQIGQLLAAAILIFAVVGIFPGRSWEFLLPLLPVLAVLTAAGMDRRYGVRLWFIPAEVLMRYIFIVAASLALALPVTWPLWNLLLNSSAPMVMMTVMPFIALAAFAAITAGVHLQRKKGGSLSGLYSALAGTVLAGVFLTVGVLCVLQPSLAKFRTGKLFWEKIGELYRSGAADMVVLYGVYPNSESSYYMNIKPEAVSVISDSDKLDAVLKKLPVQKIAIVSVKDPKKLIEISDVCRKNGRDGLAGEALVSKGFSLKVELEKAGPPEKECGVWIVEP